VTFQKTLSPAESFSEGLVGLIPRTLEGNEGHHLNLL
jgi:hypothetical protein